MIKSKLRIITAVLLVTALALGSIMAYQLDQVSRNTNVLEYKFQPIERKYLELLLQVGAMEQALMAYVITLGAYDGLAQSTHFYESSEQLLLDIEALSEPQPALKDYLNSHYALGQKIATAYVEQGTDAGNQLLGEFDALSVTIHDHIEASRQTADNNATSLKQDVGEQMLLLESLIYVFALSFIAAIFAIYYSLSRFVFSPLHKLGEMAKDLSSGRGDLTKRLKASRNDELGIIAADINQFIAKTQQLLKAVSVAGEELRQSAKAMQSSMTITLNGITMQEQEIEATSHSAQQVALGSIEVSKHTVDTSQRTKEIHSNSESVKNDVDVSERSMRLLTTKMTEAQEVIHRLGDDSHNIGSMLAVIRGISEQTNLLALNAAIEAARAGEQGRGFAVVADEVRSLAGSTSESTDKINQVIEQLASNVTRAIEVVTQCVDTTAESLETVHSMSCSIKGISGAVEGLKTMNTQIATASEEQSVVLNEIDRNMSNIAQVTRENSQTVSKLSDIVQQIQSSTTDLDSHLAQFQY